MAQSATGGENGDGGGTGYDVTGMAERVFADMPGLVKRFQPDVSEATLREIVAHFAEKAVEAPRQMAAYQASPAKFAKAVKTATANWLSDRADGREHESERGWQYSIDLSTQTDRLGRGDMILEQREVRQALENAILRLPPRCRAVFILIKLDERSYAEVAAMLGVTKKAIGGHLARATQLLRKDLAAYHPVSPEGNG